MLVYVVDDEEFVLKEIAKVVSEACGDAEIMTFLRGEDALSAITPGELPDVVFSDIVMPGISGLEFAEELKKKSPHTRIVFTTAYREYAIEAFRIKAYGYLLKPLSIDDVRGELIGLQDFSGGSSDKLEVKCFGYFDVYLKGKPLIFKRKQSKELLAYLIDRNGAACTSGEIALALWEDEDIDDTAEKNRIRVLISDLKSTLKQIGMDDVLIRDKREVAVKRDMIDCDYYRMLKGDKDVINSYNGEYMNQYGWAETTNGRLSFIAQDEPEDHHTSVLYV